MSVPFWRDPQDKDLTPWDKCYVNRKLLPGISTVRVKAARDTEKVKAKGEDGRTITDNGYAGGELTIITKLWTQEQNLAYDALIPEFHPRKPGGPKTPIPVEHPSTVSMGVAFISVKDVEIAAVEGDFSIRTITADEWFPATKKTGAKKDPSGGPFDPSDFDVPPPDPENVGTNFNT